ncbi:hypothetical protein Salat_1003300 [Sesamum alatum]|uniref:Uncharacterized protein n=1 Tax=Sesamum alatum TaxID=300844 RepID=A0AAE1YLY7_9LAMI|nr:hypothetical protein Salat_1003300 [Sesamum alatum]
MRGGGGNADSQCGEKKMEGENGVRTVDCLRGRLLAERAASRKANEEAEFLGNKLMELENLLKKEARSRNRAERKLKFLLKKLQSINITYVSDESEHSGLVDKTDISSVSSTASSSTKELQQQNENQQMKISKIVKIQEPNENDSENCSFSLSDDSSVFGDNLQAFLKSQKCEMGPNQDPMSQSVSKNSNMDELSVKSTAGEGLNEDDDQDSDRQVDDSMALVPVDMAQKNQPIDPEVLDATVKQVLDTLKHAKEQLQSSMERGRTNMIKVGRKGNRIASTMVPMVSYKDLVNLENLNWEFL